ncbi:MAG: Wzz/FepE/Etk N-terminal domain-containing protein [Chitinophagaceae bacterium]|jgi:succinoglycan biosynthesis transport protein ExoP
MELTYIIRILLKNKKYILGASFLTATVALIFSFFLKDKYESQSQISTGYTIRQEIKLSDASFDIGEIDIKFNNAIENISSPKVLNLLSYKLMMHDLDFGNRFSNVDTAEISKIKGLENLDIEAVKAILIDKYDNLTMLNGSIESEKKIIGLIEFFGYDLESLRKNLDVYRYQRSDYINIVYTSVNPFLSEFVVNQLISEFQRYFEISTRERSIEAKHALDSIVNQREIDLKNKVALKSNYLRDSINAAGSAAVNAKINKSSDYESIIADELSKIQSISYQIEQVERQIESVGTPETASAVVPSNKEYADLRRRYNELTNQYIRSGSTDASLKSEIEQLQIRLKSLASTAPATTKPDNSTRSTQLNALAKEKIELEAALRSSNARVEFYRSKLADMGVIVPQKGRKSTYRIDQLDKEIELSMMEYTSAKEKVNIVGGLVDPGQSNFKQTIYGQAALEPEPTKRLLLVAISFMSGLLLSSLVYILIAYFDQKIRTPTQFQRMTNLPLIGVINFIDLKASSLKEHIIQIESSKTSRTNNFREFLRKMRYEIESSGKRTIMFTSTEPNQGKTTLLQSLAFSLSLSKKRVLLIDTNFCNNDLSVLNAAKPTLELFSFDKVESDQNALKNLISPTGVQNVDIIGCKGGDYTPNEILPKDHILNHLDYFLTMYDYILIEGAPLNGFTDAKELSQFVDGIVAIFSANAEIKSADKESIKYFRTIPEKFLGSVLNQLDMNEYRV